MADRLQVTELDFDTIKENLKTFLNQQNQFTDYDFEGSGLSVLLDILAYNTHYNAYYLNMVANEAFLDTAILRDSVVSHAKKLGYTPYSQRAPVATINFEATSSSGDAGTMTIPSGYNFLSNQIDNVSYNFVVLNDTTVTKANSTYLFEDLQIYQGELITYAFTQNDSSNPKQIFTLPDDSIDTTTIKVVVSPAAGNTQTTVYTKVTEVDNITTTTPAYFLQESKNGKYQIYFGNNSVGKKLNDGAVVTVSYLVTSGTEANKANNFIASASIEDSLGESITTFNITPQSAAAGGSDRESVDSIKFSAASQFSTQNRLVTFKDYESYILNNYPNIDSISVWGGEDETPPVYGKVYISMKPKSNYYISETEKARILETIVNPKAIVSVEAQIRNPEYIYIVLENYVEYNKTKTTQTATALKQAIRNAIINYKTTNLDKFDSQFVLSKLQDAIDSSDKNAIIGSETILKIQKRFTPSLDSSKTYNINYGVPLHRGTTTNKLTSTEFNVYDDTGTQRLVQLEEIPNSFTGITSISVTESGTGYTENPTVTITGDGTGATAEAVVVNGRIESISIKNRGVNYTRALITINGGNGYGAAAVAVLDERYGTLRTVYFDTSAQRQVVNENAGTINYNTGLITLNNLRVLSLPTGLTQIRMTIESERGILNSIKNTIITLDTEDPISIVTELVEY